MSKRISYIFIAIIITITLLAILFSQIELMDVIEILNKIQPIYLVAGFILYAASYLLRALRIDILLNGEIGVKELFSIVCIHNMALNIFPARSGELSFIYLLNKRHKKSVVEGTVSLILIRILDFITVSILFFIFTFTVHGLPANLMNVSKIIGFILIVIILFMLIFIRNSDRFVNGLRIVSIIFNINERQFVNYLFIKIDEMSTSFKKLTFDRFVWSIIVSLCIWALVYLTSFIIVKAMGINIIFESFMLALTFFFMTSMIPIQGIGGFGTFEGGWSISFMVVGVTKEVAISSGIIMHIISIIYLILLFIIGFTGLQEKQILEK